jgi:BlaI family transcriptional regulator, penicillinase repressor
LQRRIDKQINLHMQLTRAEEQLMQILWEMKEGLVKDIRDRFDDPKPARNTISTVIRILERKEFVAHRTYGNVFVYYPLVSREEYSGSQLFGLMKNYFNDSFPAMASFFAREKDMSIRDLEKLMDELKREMKEEGKV